VGNDNNNGSPMQSVSNFDRVTTSSLCSSSLLSSVFVVVLLLPKRPAQARVPPCFCVGVIVILRHDAAADVALPILRPMNNVPMSIKGINIVTISVLPTAVAAAPAAFARIELRRIPSARQRSELSRRRRGSAPSHPSHSSSSVDANAVADAVP
jgi:hypothetical protein